MKIGQAEICKMRRAWRHVYEEGREGQNDARSVRAKIAPRRRIFAWLMHEHDVGTFKRTSDKPHLN